MYIKIKNTPSKLERKLVRKAMQFFSEKLLTPKMNDRVTVNIIFTKNFYKSTKCLASCTWSDQNERPKNFEIEIDADLSPRQTLRSLAHEMVHVKQYATGQLKDLFRNQSVKWEGATHKDSEENYNEAYWTYPWEIEAYGREVGLYVLFKQKMYREKKKSQRK